MIIDPQLPVRAVSFYIDVNSGMIALQVIVASLVGIPILLKVFWRRISNGARNLRKRILQRPR